MDEPTDVVEVPTPRPDVPEVEVPPPLPDVPEVEVPPPLPDIPRVEMAVTEEEYVYYLQKVSKMDVPEYESSTKVPTPLPDVPRVEVPPPLLPEFEMHVPAEPESESESFTKMDVPESESESFTKVRKMDLPECECESESSTKRTKRDVDSIATAHAPLPTPVDTSPSSMAVVPLTHYKIYLSDNGYFNDCDPVFEKGTTAAGFIFDEGIMISVDHSSKSSKLPKNVVELNSHMLATISGGYEFLLQDLQKMCREQEEMEGKKTSAAEALSWLAERLSDYVEELPVGILIAVWNGPDRGLYRMDGSGEFVEDYIHATGSGSVEASVELEFGYGYAPFSCTYSCGIQRRHKCNISVTEATDLARRSICKGAFRAPHSGDTFSVYYVGSGGCKMVLLGDVEEWTDANLKLDKWKYVVIGPGW